MPVSNSKKAAPSEPAATTTAQAKPPAQEKPAKVKPADRPVKYPELEVRLATGEFAVGTDLAEELLGWEEEGDGEKFGSEHVAEVSSLYGKKVRLTNNVTNRPFYGSNCLALVQEHLQRKWRFNGEPIIVGRTALILNGQHQLVSVKLAEAIRAKNPEKYPLWSGPITMEKVIIFGVDESDPTVNTMDTCKPRSLADVIYRSEFFGSMKADKRKDVSRMTDFAVRTVWNRTGVANAFGLRQTHAEALDLLERHKNLLKCVKHIYEENKDKKISTAKISPGYAAGYLFLMAASASDPEAYARERSDKALNWANKDKAEEFWVLLAQRSPTLHEVIMALKGLADPDTGSGGSQREKEAILARAWGAFVAGKPVTADVLQLYYRTDDEGYRYLAECPLFGGIDVGYKKKAADGTDEEEGAEEGAAEESPATNGAPEANGPSQRAKDLTATLLSRRGAVGEVQPEGTSATVAEAGQGKPPAPKIKKPAAAAVPAESGPATFTPFDDPILPLNPTPAVAETKPDGAAVPEPSPAVPAETVVQPTPPATEAAPQTPQAEATAPAAEPEKAKRKYARKPKAAK